MQESSRRVAATPSTRRRLDWHPTHWLIYAQVFLGGSVLADIMRERSEFWMSKREYEEDGIDRCLAKCR